MGVMQRKYGNSQTTESQELARSPRPEAFSVGERVLYLKKMSFRTTIADEEKSMPGLRFRG